MRINATVAGVGTSDGFFRLRRNGWHRAAGRILIPCGLVAALSGLWMARSSPWPAGDGQILYVERLVFGSAMVLSIALSVVAVRRINFRAHGRWMLRAYAIGLGSGTQVLTHLPWFLIMGDTPSETPRAVLMGAGWVINVVVAEWIIRREVARPVAVAGPERWDGEHCPKVVRGAVH